MPATVETILTQGIIGDPGTTWRNDTDRLMYQLVCQFSNSCARCISLAGRVARSWATPFHYGCNCVSVPVYPGAESTPFLDYREEMAKLSPAQQNRAMGKSNWALVKAGVVPWDEVVRRGRILPLEEVVLRNRLDRATLLKAGVRPDIADRALSPPSAPQAAAKVAAVRVAAEGMRAAGVTEAQIQQRATQTILKRIGTTYEGPVTHAMRFDQLPGWDGASALALGSYIGLNGNGKHALNGTAKHTQPEGKPGSNGTNGHAKEGPAIPLGLESFASKVVDAAADVVPAMGQTKRYIHHVYEAVKDQPEFTGMSLDQFKAKLVAASNKGLVDLSRADLVEALNPEDVAASNTKHPGGAIFNFIRAPKRKQ